MVSFPQLIVQIVKELRLADPEDGRTAINSATRRPFYRINCKRKSRWTNTPLMVGRQTKSILAAERPINGRESSRALTGRAHRRVPGRELQYRRKPDAAPCGTRRSGGGWRDGS